MSNRREDDSRPVGNATSQRNTSRDVPAAKFKEGSVGTVAPRGLRGPSLLPGQGAPERINPEDVELAVLRDAETMDGPNVARAAGRRLPDPRLPSPTPVSVEVPRARSAPPSIDEIVITPPSPSARSIQSGTLMSIGSVDPRAPTELSLPSPRPLSVSERAAYLGPEAVVDRTPVNSPRELPGVVDSSRFSPTERPTSPSSGPLPSSSSRSVPVGSGGRTSGRPALSPDSVAPPAQNFARAPRSHGPNVATPSARGPASMAGSSRRDGMGSARSAPLSNPDAAPQFQIHSELDAVPQELKEDNFDLRSASTLREPLAGRRQQDSADWTAHGLPPESAPRGSDPGVRLSRHSSSAVTILVDRGHDTVPPTSERAAPTRATVPVSWVLGAAGFAVLLALLVAWVLHVPAAQRATTYEVDARATAVAPSGAPLLLPAPVETPAAALSQHVEQPPAAPYASAPRAPNASPKTATPRQPANAATTGAGTQAPGAAPEPSSKVHQSIY